MAKNLDKTAKCLDEWLIFLDEIFVKSRIKNTKMDFLNKKYLKNNN